jgi:glycosyltransferase involved in cell wall biosynthesis
MAADRDGAMTPVYLYVHDLRSSGVVRNALSYARRIVQERPVTLVAGYGDGLFGAEAARGPFALAILAEHAGRNARLAAIPRLRRWLGRQPPGILVSMGAHGHPTVLPAAFGLRHIRRVYRMSNEVAGPVKGESRLRRWALGLAVRDATRIVLVGGAMTGHAAFAGALRTGKAVAIPNGVDRTRALALARQPSPHPWLDDRDIPVVIAVGRLRPQKNLDLLIRAVALARDERRLRLIIVGGGTAAERARMGALAGDFAEDFLLAGETDNVFAWIARAAVFALPSRWETSSLALLEAMAVGTPVVASRLAGDAAMVLDHGRYGLLFDGHDPAALAQALLKQLSADRVMPGDRADAYSIARTADLYADLLRAFG